MIAKLTTGNGFFGAASYMLRNGKSDEEKAKVRILAAVGVDYKTATDGSISVDARQVARDFRFQAMMHPSVRKPVYDIALSWKTGENIPSEEKLARSEEFLRRIGFVNTQYLIVEHEKENEHAHAIVNIVDNDGDRISTEALIERMHEIARDMTITYGYAWGKPAKETIINAHKPHEKVRYIIEPIVKDAEAKARCIEDLPELLEPSGVGCTIKYSKEGVPVGISFSYEMDGQLHTFKGSALDRSLSASNIVNDIAARQAQEEAEREAAAEAARKAREKTTAEAAEVENANKNRFWNAYNSHYKPLIDGIQKSIGDSFRMHDALKEDIRDCGREISARYARLREINDQINIAKRDIEKASNSHDLWSGLSALVLLMNPIAGLVMGFVFGLVTEANRSAAIETRKALYAEAKAIRYDIDLLKEEQSQLRAKDAEVMKVAVEDKAAKKELIDEINALKAELDKPIEPPKQKFAFDFKTAARQTAAPVNRSQATTTVAVPTAKSAVDMYSILISAKDKNSLELALLDQKVVIEPIKDRYGGVADFKVTQASEGQVVNASSLVSGDRMRVMLDKWENLTGESPAYKLEIQREHRKKLADICTKMDAASPENAPRIPRNITFLPGGEIRVFYYNTGRQEEQDIMVDASGKMKFNGLILDVNTGEYSKFPSQGQVRQQSKGEYNGEGKGQGRRKI